MKKPKKIFLLIVSVALITGIGLLVWSFLIEPDRLLVRTYELKLKKWSKRFDGLKIVAISDLHAGSSFITEDKLRRIAAAANAQDPDIVVLLGDYVAPAGGDRRQLKMPMHLIAENLRPLRAKYGVYAILGNTDEAYDGNDAAGELKKNGFKVLRDETTGIEINGARIRLLGLKDQMSSGDWNYISGELKKILARDEREEHLIVLVHNPDYLHLITGDLLISDDLSLILAGHTHGGQCRFPVIGAPVVPSEYGQKYAAGHVRAQEVDMFVTTGIGTSNIPARLGVPPEISVLKIYAE